MDEVRGREATNNCTFLIRRIFDIFMHLRKIVTSRDTEGVPAGEGHFPHLRACIQCSDTRIFERSSSFRAPSG